ncbi:MAG: tRNA (N(6)-L-threonylcarbamoyladenosine(37)-C(2))-methylthiotransferase MtaB [Candidatus Makaraimicrobium thalassicum]|nr:MAG: tRNA (N(6)-L-threonylcarbamoyladenosine(37)-C(2))-methylthiotransferase MtaB [Candidatus Omnitrophota bacterium]
MKAPKFAIKTLGCKVNQYEEQVLRENLLRFGFQESGPGKADLFIVNSCTVTDQADRKTKKLIRRVKRENPRVKIFVTGCYAVFEEDIEELRSLPEVHRVVPGRDKMRLPHLLGPCFSGHTAGKRVEERVSGFDSHTRGFLKMQDGCDQNCSYCKVRLVRGSSRCRDEHDILDEVTRLAGKGYKEIVLTGICLGAWTGSKGQGIPDILREIDRVEGDFRVRLSSIEPNYIDDSLIETIAASRRICRHLHIPLQNGSDRILGLMNRRYTTEQFRALVRRIRKLMPLAGLTTDVIVGFPGESEMDFDRTLRFIRDIEPSRLHVFKYSDRRGTSSFRVRDKVSSIVARDRVALLIKAGDELKAEFCNKFIGREVDVLAEHRSKGVSLAGYTGEYLRTRLDGFDGSAGNIIRVKIHSVDKNSSCLLASFI